jgi:hypothetical protein
MPRARCRILSGSRALARVVATRRPRRGRPAPCRRSRPAGPEASRRAPERPAGSRRARVGGRGRRQLRRWSTSRPVGPRHTSRNGTPPPTPGRPGGRRRHPADRVASTPAERPRRAVGTRMIGPRLSPLTDRAAAHRPAGRRHSPDSVASTLAERPRRAVDARIDRPWNVAADRQGCAPSRPIVRPNAVDARTDQWVAGHVGPGSTAPRRGAGTTVHETTVHETTARRHDHVDRETGPGSGIRCSGSRASRARASG